MSGRKSRKTPSRKRNSSKSRKRTRTNCSKRNYRKTIKTRKTRKTGGTSLLKAFTRCVGTLCGSQVPAPAPHSTAEQRTYHDLSADKRAEYLKLSPEEHSQLSDAEKREYLELSDAGKREYSRLRREKLDMLKTLTLAAIHADQQLHIDSEAARQAHHAAPHNSN